MVDLAALERGIRTTDRRAIARAITLVESSRSDHQATAGALLERLAHLPDDALRIGLSGPPGAGKSTFIEAFGMFLVDHGHTVAVLAVDPSSAISGGAILGDKTRMERLARHPHAFIRPTPSGATLGGIARHTREAMRITEAAGFDIVIIETVGVGQSEAAVAAMTDIFVLMLPPGAGDELQGIKRGIIELAHLILINKADGALIDIAEQTAVAYRNALGLFAGRDVGWNAEVHTCSALDGSGINEAWNCIERYRGWYETTDTRSRKRSEQSHEWLWNEISRSLRTTIEAHRDLKHFVASLEERVAMGRISATTAAQQIIAAVFGAGD